jgi:hypothetical protein
MKTLFHSRDRASKGAALMIVLALVVLLTGLALAYMSRTTTDRQLAQTSYNDTSADLLARSALDIVVNDFKQEIINDPRVATRNDIQPARYTPVPQIAATAIPNLIRQSFSGDPTGRTSNVNSTVASANGRSTSLARWNSHYLIPLANTSDDTIDSTPVGLNQSHYSSFTAPDWVLVTAQGPVQAPAPSAVIGRYALAVYDEGGLLDMSMAGYPSWSGVADTNCPPSPTPFPSPTPWQINVGRKGIMAFADLSALPWPSVSPSPSTRIDNIVGWRNYAMTQRTGGSFGNFSYTGETDCTKQDWYGSYLLNFGNPPFIIDSLSDKLLASQYPFTSAATYAYPTPGPGVNSRTDQSLMTRQELLKVMLSLGSSSTGYNQNVLQYMGTFSRERNRPAPDWPGLAGRLGEGRFNLNNLALVLPNPADCSIAPGRKVGWQTGKNKNHLCGDSEDIHKLFGLFWVRADVVSQSLDKPGYWRYIGNRNPFPGPSGTPAPIPIGCLIGPTRQNDFFQILDYALFQADCETDDQHLAKTFAIGASLIDQYDSGDACGTRNNSDDFTTGCDLDARVKQQSLENRTHTTVILYGQGNGNSTTAYGMEPDYSSGDHANGDDPWQGNCNSNQSGNNPHRPCGAPNPGPNTQVISHAFATVGEFGYGINTSDGTLPTLKFWDSSTSPRFQYAPVLDFFSYNPISSAYPRAGIVNLYTRNAPVLAAILSRTLEKDPGPTPSPSPTPVVSAADAMSAANAIVAETQRVLAGNPTYGSVQQTDLTRAIAGRLAKAAFDQVPNLATSDETKGTVARALAEMGQTRTWNLLIDVIAQTGKYKPNAQDLTGSNFVVEGEKRYWLHIALGRDLVHADGTPCYDGLGCHVDVLGTQLEEVTE